MKRIMTLLFVVSFVCAHTAHAQMKKLPAVKNIAPVDGLIVVIGKTIPENFVTRKSGKTVHILLAAEKEMTTLRKQLNKKNVYGAISVQQWQGKQLPYASNIINTLILSGKGLNISEAEVLRVLCPGGNVYRQSQTGWKVAQKIIPSDIDEWTHFLHNADGNAVANDTRIKPPKSLQWSTIPTKTRDHDALASFSTMVSSQGRIFYIFDEGETSLIHNPPKWKLIARDAYNGIVLWEKTIPDWITTLYKFRAGPVWLQRRLVSIDDRVYVPLGLKAPISALDAKTGDPLFNFESTEKCEELIILDNYLFAVIGDPEKPNREVNKPFDYGEYTVNDKHPVKKNIIACDLSTGKTLWTLKSDRINTICPLSLTARGEKLYYLDDSHLHCLNRKDGSEIWKAEFKTKGSFLRAFAPTVVATDKTILCLTRHQLISFAVKDGKKLWEKKGYIGFGSPGDLFVIDGTVWTVIVNFKGDICGIDQLTGEVLHRIDPKKVLPPGHHHRCYRNRATKDFFICGRRGVEFINIKNSKYIHNMWIRGVCQYGIMPANGLLYIPQDPCRCFINTKLNGFLALTNDEMIFQDQDKPHLIKGPAFSSIGTATPTTVNPKDWPTYRQNATRRGVTSVQLSPQLKVAWQRKFSNSLSSTTFADGKLFAAEVNAHTVHCFDATNGETIWSYVVNGRVDSPPTIYKGLALFGSRDGWVYAVDIKSGTLSWKFQGAPHTRFIVVEEQLESSWPVPGSILIQKGVAYFVAGRLSHLNEGITLYGLEATTGKKVHESKIFTPALTTIPKRSYSSRNAPDGALPSVLSGDESGIYMRNNLVHGKSSGSNKLLMASTGFLDNTWFHRVSWAYKKTQAKFKMPKKTDNLMGKLIVHNDEFAYTVKNRYSTLKYTKSLWPKSHKGSMHQKYSNYSENQFLRGVLLSAVSLTNNKQKWTFNIPIQVRAMLLAGDHLFIAGWRDAHNELRNKENGWVPPSGDTLTSRPVLYSFNAKEGKAIKGYELPARPVFDGMSATENKLFISTKDGSLTCFESVTK